MSTSRLIWAAGWLGAALGCRIVDVASNTLGHLRFHQVPLEAANGTATSSRRPGNSLTHSLTSLLTHSLTILINYSPTHSLIHSLTFLMNYSLTHSLTLSSILFRNKRRRKRVFSVPYKRLLQRNWALGH